MFRNDKLDFICDTLLVFVKEVNEQAAAIRAYCNVFSDQECNNVYINRANDAIWRELLSEIARIFDSAGEGTNKNCTLLRLKLLCLSEPYSALFPGGAKDNLIQSLDDLFVRYNQLPIKKSRRKQLAHHDLKQVIGGECIEISFEQVENLVKNTTEVFSKIYTRFSLGVFEISFPDYKILVECFERDIKNLLPHL